MAKKVLYTWEEFDSDSQQIAKELRQYGKMIKNIYGIPRGGLVLAVKLSYETGIPIALQKKDISADTLIVDDICDTGKTLNQLLSNKRFFRIITLWRKEGANYPVQSFHQKEDKWVVFPWENINSSKYDGTAN